MAARNAVGEYEITTADDLIELCDRVASGDSCKGLVFRQQADIDLSAVLCHTPDGSWRPIGNATNPFCGRYVGAGTDGTLHVISGMDILKCAQSYIGLFGYLGKEGQIEHVFLRGVKIRITKDYCYTGGLAGVCLGNIENCAVTGEIQNEGRDICAGGLTGLLEKGGVICSSFYDGQILAAGEVFAVGGLVGSSLGDIRYCYQHGAVTGEAKEQPAVPVCCNSEGANYVGGIAGENGKCIFRCYNLGKVRGEGAEAGGIVGSNKTLDQDILASVENCFYWKKAVDKKSAVGAALSLREMVMDEFLDQLDAERKYFVWETHEEGMKWKLTPILSCFKGREICKEAVMISTMCVDIESFAVKPVTEEADRQPVMLKWYVLNGEWAKIKSRGEWIHAGPSEEAFFVELAEGEELELLLQGFHSCGVNSEVESLQYQAPLIETFTWSQTNGLSGNFFLSIHDAEGFLEPGLVASGRGRTLHFDSKGGGGGGITPRYLFRWSVKNAVKVILIVNQEKHKYVSGEAETVLQVDLVQSAVLLAEDTYGYQVKKTGKC